MRRLGQSLRILTFTVTLVALPVAAHADSLYMNASVDASFQELGYAGGGDVFTITNTSQENANITQLVIDTSSSLAGVYFNPSGAFSSPYDVDSTVAAETGFAGFTNTSDNASQLVLQFTDFNPGETFTFEVDVDDRYGWFVTSRDFSGTMLTTIFGKTNSTAELFGAFEKGSSWYVAEANLEGPATVTWVNPEPSSWMLMSIGAAVLGMHRWRKRRKRNRAA